ncbi:hypothetical protein E5288_WYG018228 [Bos mutus]|uniref:Uncharacterized protein n=1 Tax=Bos mutus TaxID=72004 RepID=A0A6B0S6T9_9CETA|nr:hypothetical protein [Bos mutus]
MEPVPAGLAGRGAPCEDIAVGMELGSPVLLVWKPPLEVTRAYTGGGQAHCCACFAGGAARGRRCRSARGLAVLGRCGWSARLAVTCPAGPGAPLGGQARSSATPGQC